MRVTPRSFVALHGRVSALSSIEVRLANERMNELRCSVAAASRFEHLPPSGTAMRTTADGVARARAKICCGQDSGDGAMGGTVPVSGIGWTALKLKNLNGATVNYAADDASQRGGMLGTYTAQPSDGTQFAIIESCAYRSVEEDHPEVCVTCQLQSVPQRWRDTQKV